MHPMQLLAFSFCLWIDVVDVVMTNGLASIVVALPERMTTRITANANIVAMVENRIVSWTSWKCGGWWNVEPGVRYLRLLSKLFKMNEKLQGLLFQYSSTGLIDNKLRRLE